jgi:DNA modification methylase
VPTAATIRFMVTTNQEFVHELAVANVDISDLRPNPQNPRERSDKQIKQLAKSIKSFGFVSPILIDAKGRIVAGHGRLRAAKLLGLKEVPTISVRHLSDSQIRALIIADNRLAEQASWNEQLLGEQLKVLSELELDFELEATGFEVAEIDLLIEGLSPAHGSQLDQADQLPRANTVNVSAAGDLWLLGKHRVLCGNALDTRNYSTLLPTARASMIFTDPPFNVKISGHAGGLGTIRHRDFQMASGEMSETQFTDFLTQVFNLLTRHGVEGSLHYVFMDWRHMREILEAGKAVYTELKNLCVWAKDNGGMGSLYRSQHELVFVFKSGTATHRNNIQLGKFGRYRTNVWTYPGANSFSRSTDEGNLLELHPTVKPVALVADAIMDCTARGEIILDAFLGSGTTVIAAERTGRICCGLEIDPTYMDIIVRRWQVFTGKVAVHAASGRNFDDLQAEVSR